MFRWRSYAACVAMVVILTFAWFNSEAWAQKIGLPIVNSMHKVALVKAESETLQDKEAQKRADAAKVVEYELLRTQENTYQRTTIRLYVKPLRPDVVVTARFFLNKDGTNFARFPLRRLDTEPGRVPTEKDDGRMLFMAECLAEEFLKESRISLSVHDAKTHEPVTGVVVPLSGAVVRKRS